MPKSHTHKGCLGTHKLNLIKALENMTPSISNARSSIKELRLRFINSKQIIYCLSASAEDQSCEIRNARGMKRTDARDRLVITG